MAASAVQVANFQSEMAVLREEHECTVTRMQTEHAAEVTALNGQLESVRGELATTKVRPPSCLWHSSVASADTNALQRCCVAFLGAAYRNRSPHQH